MTEIDKDNVYANLHIGDQTFNRVTIREAEYYLKQIRVALELDAGFGFINAKHGSRYVTVLVTHQTPIHVEWSENYVPNRY